MYVYSLYSRYFVNRLIHIAHRDALVADYVPIYLSDFLPAMEISVRILKSKLGQPFSRGSTSLQGTEKLSNIVVALFVPGTTTHTSLVVAVSSLRHKEYIT